MEKLRFLLCLLLFFIFFPVQVDAHHLQQSSYGRLDLYNRNNWWKLVWANNWGYRVVPNPCAVDIEYYGGQQNFPNGLHATYHIRWQSQTDEDFYRNYAFNPTVLPARIQVSTDKACDVGQFWVEISLGDPVPIPDYTPPVVTITPSGGEFITSQTVEISSNEPGTIYYSLDGSDPSVLYTGPLTITDTTTVKAKAKDQAGNWSSVVSATFTKRISPPTLTFSPDTTIFDRPFDLSIIPGEPSAQVYYSIDGSDPTVLYTGPIRIDRQLTVKAKAVYQGLESPVYERTFTPASIQRTDQKFFMVPVDSGAIIKHSKDLISTVSPGTWLFASAFAGLVLMGFLGKVGK